MPTSPWPSPARFVVTVTNGPFALSKAAETVLAVFIVKVHVVVAHAVASPVPLEKTPGGLPPAMPFATIRTTVPTLKETVHGVDDGLSQRSPLGMMPNLPGLGPTRVMVNGTVTGCVRAGNGLAARNRVRIRTAAVRTRIPIYSSLDNEDNEIVHADTYTAGRERQRS